MRQQAQLAWVALLQLLFGYFQCGIFVISGKLYHQVLDENRTTAIFHTA